MAGWCTEAQVRLAGPTQTVTALADRDRDKIADAGVITQWITMAAYMMQSILLSRADLAASSTWRIAAYTAGSGVYPGLETWNAQLAYDVGRDAERRDQNAFVGPDHPVLSLCARIARGEAELC